MAGYRSDMRVLDILEAHPKAAEVLLSFGLPCARCVVAEFETLAEGLRPHDLAVELVLSRLNAEAPMGDGPGEKKLRRESRAE